MGSALHGFHDPAPFLLLSLTSVHSPDPHKIVPTQIKFVCIHLNMPHSLSQQLNVWVQNNGILNDYYNHDKSTGPCCSPHRVVSISKRGFSVQDRDGFNRWLISTTKRYYNLPSTTPPERILDLFASCFWLLQESYKAAVSQGPASQCSRLHFIDRPLLYYLVQRTDPYISRDPLHSDEPNCWTFPLLVTQAVLAFFDLPPSDRVQIHYQAYCHVHTRLNPLKLSRTDSAYVRIKTRLKGLHVWVPTPDTPPPTSYTTPDWPVSLMSDRKLNSVLPMWRQHHSVSWFV